MTSRLAVIKDLRDKGASIKMIDDVAAHVGSYDNTAFIATVELILKIKNMAKSYSQDKEQSAGLADNIQSIRNDDSLRDASYAAAKSAIENDDETSEDDRKKMLEHLAVVENNKDSYIVAENFRKMEEQGVTPKSNAGRKSRNNTNTSKNTLTDKLNKLVSHLTGQKNQKQQNEAVLRENAMRLAQQQRQQQQQQQGQQQNTNQSRSLLKMNLLKMKLMEAIKLKKDYSIYGTAQWQASQKVNPHLNNAALKRTEKANKDPAKTTQEFISSQAIDQIIKSDKPKNNLPAVETEKGKFTQQVAEKAAPKANEEAVAKMAAQEAIAKLQNSGMKTTAAAAPATQVSATQTEAEKNAIQQQQQKQR